MKVIVTLISAVLSLSSVAGVKYVTTDVKCPQESETSKYIEAPMFHDLVALAEINNISNLRLHEGFRESYAGKSIGVYYELLAPYDENKELLIMIPGGPGQTHTFIHSFQEKLEGFGDFTKKYNVFVMDHRGVGCSRYSGPGEYPAESLLMRQAASDIEMIRAKYGKDKKINVWGYSYGSMLAQTYSLLYPKNLGRIFVGGAFSAATDFKDAMRTFEQRVLNATVEIQEDYTYLKLFYPKYAHKFLKIAESHMYKYDNFKYDLVKLIKDVKKALLLYDLDEADRLLNYDGKFVMEWMMRSIVCIEIFPNKLEEGMFPLFWESFSTCSEFDGKEDYFDYTNDLVNISSETFIWGGEHDHVTPAVAMRKMSKKIPSNYLYIDKHIGHGMDKPECFMNMMDSFFEFGISKKLDSVKESPVCSEKPKGEDLSSTNGEVSRISIF